LTNEIIGGTKWLIRRFGVKEREDGGFFLSEEEVKGSRRELRRIERDLGGGDSWNKNVIRAGKRTLKGNDAGCTPGKKLNQVLGKYIPGDVFWGGVYSG